MPEFRLTLKIDKIGDVEALNALNALDAKGRRIVEGVSGATGRAMGEVALAYERGSKSARTSLEQIAKEHEKNIATMLREERAADALGRRQGLATLSATRGIEQIVRSGALLSSSLDQSLSQVSQLAFGFGVTGPIVGAIGVATVAMVGFFRKAHEETVKLAREMAQEINRISHQDVTEQALTAQRLYSGDEAATDISQYGISQLSTMGAALRQRIRAGTSTFRDITSGQQRTVLSEDAAQAAEQLKLVQQRLAEIKPLYDSIMGVGGLGGTLQRAAQRQAALDLPGFVTDDLAKAAKADKAGEKLAKKLADAYQRALAHDMKEATKLAVQQTIEAAGPSVEARHSIADAIFGEADARTKRLADDMKDAIRQAAETVANDPMVIKVDSLEELSKQWRTAIVSGLSDGLVSAIDAGMQRAFSGSGAVGFLEGFGQAILKAFGGIMEQMGAALISYGVAMELVSVGLANPFTSGPAAIAAGALLVGLGAALSAAVSGHGSRSVGGGGYSGSTGLANIIDRGVINPDSYSQRTASSIPKRAGGDTFVFYGANDPQAVRWLDEMDRKRQQRGSLVPARA